MGLRRRLREFVGIQTSAQHFRDTANALSVFVPYSANFQTVPDLTYQSANRFPAQLIGLSTDIGIAETVTIRDAVSFSDGPRLAGTRRYLDLLPDSSATTPPWSFEPGFSLRPTTFRFT